MSFLLGDHDDLMEIGVMEGAEGVVGEVTRMHANKNHARTRACTHACMLALGFDGLLAAHFETSKFVSEDPIKDYEGMI